MHTKILTLNDIAVAGLRMLPREHYEVASEMVNPDAIILRSFNMHAMDIPQSVAAVARAGAGVNNIPVEQLSQRGIPVFNAPGANANAVKELVFAGLLMAARNLCPAWDYVRNFKGAEADFAATVEAGKKQFVGFELPGRTLGVIGLGAIGVEVANTALALGMNVIGYDPDLTVQRALQLSSGIAHADTLDQLFTRADAVSVHVPLVEDTRGLVNHDRLALMVKGGVLLNFSRGGVVDNEDVLAALNSGQLHAYVCDFPTLELIAHKKVIALPHLGASTNEAEENCAVMVARNLRDFLENGNIRNSVNFPEAIMPRDNSYRMTVANMNVPNMVGQITTCLAEADLNIEDLLNKSKGGLAYTVVDLNAEVPPNVIEKLRAIKGVQALRYLGKATS